MRDVVSYTDHFIICTGRTPRQTQAISDAIRESLKRDDKRSAQRVEGQAQGDWILIDYLDVVTHIFTPEAREFYRLESLWGQVPSEKFAAGMSEPRLFTPEQAQTLLDERVRDLAERMVSERSSSRKLEKRWNAVVIAIGGNGGDFDRPELTELRAALEQAHEGLRAIMAELDELGVEIKDIDRGLLDFPSEIEGQEALLCWDGGRAANRVLAFARRMASPAGVRWGDGWYRSSRRHWQPRRRRIAGCWPARTRRRSWDRRPRRLPGISQPSPGNSSCRGRLLGALKMAILAGDGVEADRPQGGGRGPAGRHTRIGSGVRARAGRSRLGGTRPMSL